MLALQVASHAGGGSCMQTVSPALCRSSVVAQQSPQAHRTTSRPRSSGMRFKGTFTDTGLSVLAKSYVPALEKFGKACQVLLRQDDISFIQTSVNTDGAHVVLRMAVGQVFEQHSYVCNSKHLNLIAFRVELALLVKVLKGAVTNNGSLTVKLSQLPIVNAEGNREDKPVLHFTGTGQDMNVNQDLFIGKPFSPDDVDRLVRVSATDELCAYYLDLAPATQVLGAMVDKLKALGDSLSLVTCKNGDLHLTVSTSSISLGSQVQSLPVLPEGTRAQFEVDRSTTVEAQLQSALDAGDASSVYVSLKLLSKVLQANGLVACSQLLCGVAGSGDVHVIGVFRRGNMAEEYDSDTTLNFRLPVRDEG